MTEAMRLLLFRAYRVLRGRDFCEVCPGDTGVRGNEQVVDGVAMCDDCHARHMDKEKARLGAGYSVNSRRVATSLRSTVRLNRGQSAEAVAAAVLEIADALERGELGDVKWRS